MPQRLGMFQESPDRLPRFPSHASRCALAPTKTSSCSTARATRKMFSRPWAHPHRSQNSQPGPSMPNNASNSNPASSTSARSSSGWWKKAVVNHSMRALDFGADPLQDRARRCHGIPRE